MQGTYRGNIKLMNVDVHIGKQDGKDHGELSFYEMGDMHNAVDNAEDAHFRKDNTIALRSAGLEDLPCAGINTNDVKRFYSV